MGKSAQSFDLWKEGGKQLIPAFFFVVCVKCISEWCGLKCNLGKQPHLCGCKSGRWGTPFSRQHPWHCYRKAFYTPCSFIGVVWKLWLQMPSVCVWGLLPSSPRWAIPDAMGWERWVPSSTEHLWEKTEGSVDPFPSSGNRLAQTCLSACRSSGNYNFFSFLLGDFFSSCKY